MDCRRLKSFDKQLTRLPETTQQQFEKQRSLLLHDRQHPSLHFKKLVNREDVYSIRISGSYRALFILTEDSYVFFAVGHRKDIYR